MTPISDYDRAHPPVDYPIPLIVPTTPDRASGAFVILIVGSVIWGVGIAWMVIR